MMKPSTVAIAIAVVATWSGRVYAFRSQGHHVTFRRPAASTTKLSHFQSRHRCKKRSVALTLPLLPQFDDDRDKEGLILLSSLPATATYDNGGWLQNQRTLPFLGEIFQSQNSVPYISAASGSVGELAASLIQPSSTHASTAYFLVQAGLVGSITGIFVVVFKLAIEAVRTLCYEQAMMPEHHALLPLIPALGGAVVGILLMLGGPFSPGLKGTVEEVDQAGTGRTIDDDSTASAWEHIKVQANSLRKSSAAIATLGTGCSLGPEGPAVEIGLNVARAFTQLNKPIGGTLATLQEGASALEKGWNRILLSCGAAAGVAAGFNAPVAGVFFALEIMQRAFTALDKKWDDDTSADYEVPAKSDSSLTGRLSTALFSITSTATITPILIASVLSALISQSLLGDHLVLTMPEINLEAPLMELPLYLALGSMSGVVAFFFNHSAKISKQFFSGEWGPLQVRKVMSDIPDAAKPMIGGLLCGLVGLVFPQILFFGYETLNSLLMNNSLPVTMSLTLLLAKTVMTATAAGSGLVGGTFALALFLGAMLGSAFQNGSVQAIDAIMHWNAAGHPALDAILAQVHVADVPAYAMVGAASVLAALFRAPLTASLLLFEVTRNYDAILPLMASAGIATTVGDMMDDYFEKKSAEESSPEIIDVYITAEDAETPPGADDGFVISLEQ